MQNKLFKKYRSRLTAEAAVKSLLIGASVGFGAAALMGLASWFFGFEAGLYIAIGLFVVITGVLSAILYLKKFRPTTKTVARRIDELGLEERVITMTELEGDDSYIAVAQREDTVKALGSVSHLLLKIAVTASMIATVAVCGVLFAGSVTVGGLYNADVIPSGIALLRGEEELAKYTVNYGVARGTQGRVVYYTEDWDNGMPFDSALVLYAGEDAPAVLAVPEQGWAFLQWSDGKTDPFRQDIDVGGNIEITAIFSNVSESIEADEAPKNDPLEFPDGSGGQPPADNTDYDRINPGSQIEDGQTYYGDNYSDVTQETMDKLQGNDNISDDMKGHISDFFDALSPGGGEDSGDGSDGNEGSVQQP